MPVVSVYRSGLVFNIDFISVCRHIHVDSIMSVLEFL